MTFWKGTGLVGGRELRRQARPDPHGRAVVVVLVEASTDHPLHHPPHRRVRRSRTPDRAALGVALETNGNRREWTQMPRSPRICPWPTAPAFSPTPYRPQRGWRCESRIHALARLGPLLPQADQPGTLAVALQAAEALPYDQSRCSALATLAPHLDYSSIGSAWRMAQALITIRPARARVAPLADTLSRTYPRPIAPPCVPRRLKRRYQSSDRPEADGRPYTLQSRGCLIQAVRSRFTGRHGCAGRGPS